MFCLVILIVFGLFDYFVYECGLVKEEGVKYIKVFLLFDYFK